MSGGQQPAGANNVDTNAIRDGARHVQTIISPSITQGISTACMTKLNENALQTTPGNEGIPTRPLVNSQTEDGKALDDAHPSLQELSILSVHLKQHRSN